MNKPIPDDTLRAYYTEIGGELALSIQEFAEKATFWGQELGILLTEKELSSRLVQDYIRRGIISNPERDGKKGVFRGYHLEQILEARQLLNQGYRLDKVADMVKSRRTEALRIDPEMIFSPAKTAAQNEIDAIRSKYEPSIAKGRPSLIGTREAGIEPTPEGMENRKPPPVRMSSSGEPPSAIAETGSPYDRDEDEKPDDLQSLLNKLNPDPRTDKQTQLTKLELVEGLELLIDPEKLKSLDRQKRKMLTRAFKLLLNKISEGEE